MRNADTDQTTNARVEETDKEVHIIITDITLHTNQACNPSSFARTVQKSLTNHQPGRAYFNHPIRNAEGDRFKFEIPLSEGLLEVIERAKSQGKVLRFFVPKDGIPVFAGKDTVEKVEALKRKGLL